MIIHMEINMKSIVLFFVIVLSVKFSLSQEKVADKNYNLQDMLMCLSEVDSQASGFVYKLNKDKFIVFLTKDGVYKTPFDSVAFDKNRLRTFYKLVNKENKLLLPATSIVYDISDLNWFGIAKQFFTSIEESSKEKFTKDIRYTNLQEFTITDSNLQKSQSAVIGSNPLIVTITDKISESEAFAIAEIYFKNKIQSILNIHSRAIGYSTTPAKEDIELYKNFKNTFYEKCNKNLNVFYQENDVLKKL